ncbi:MAG: FtsX-like permease family protein [Verrucomicrobiota bacterium]
MLMSLGGIIFGVGFFIVTQAQTSGFERFFIKTILGVNGMARIEDRWQSTMRSMRAEKGSNFKVSLENSVKYISGVEFPQQIMEAVSHFPDVVAAAPVIRGSAMIIANFREFDCKPYGIDIDRHFQVSDLEEQLISGSVEAFQRNPYGVLIGERLARRMNLIPNDTFLLRALGQSNRFRVAGVFETGIEQVDKERVYMHLAASRTLLQRPTGASFIQINLDDPEKAPAFSERLGPVLSHSVMSWQRREKTWLQVFYVLRISSALTVSTIILISGLGMFNTLVMIIIDKTREIAILRSMGYTRSDITQIFMMQGIFVLFAGIVLGWAFAAATTFGLSKLPIRIRGIFATDSFIVNWDFSHYLWAAVIAAVIVGIASYFPARRAARLEPGAVIRGSSS